MPKGQNIFELAKWLDEGVSVQKIESLNETIGIGACEIPLQQYLQDLIDQGEVEIKNDKYTAAGKFRKRLNTKKR